MEIKIRKLTDKEFLKKGIQYWPVWEKEASCFEWNYDSEEEFFIIEGELNIKTKSAEYHVTSGDFVTCPKGLDCDWEVKEYVKKHYHFIDE